MIAGCLKLHEYLVYTSKFSLMWPQISTPSSSAKAMALCWLCTWGPCELWFWWVMMLWKTRWWTKQMTLLAGDKFLCYSKLPGAMVMQQFYATRFFMYNWESIVNFCHSLHNCTFKGLGISNGDRWRQLRRFTLTTLRDFGMGRKGMELWIQEESRHLVTRVKSTRGLPVLQCLYSLFCSCLFVECLDIFMILQLRQGPNNNQSIVLWKYP